MPHSSPPRSPVINYCTILLVLQPNTSRFCIADVEMADAEELSPADIARLCSTMRDWLLAGRSNVYKLDELMEALRAAGLQFSRHAVIKVCV